MKILSWFWILIPLISLSAFAPASKAETNIKTYDKPNTQQRTRRIRRRRRISYRIPVRARVNNRSRIITTRGTATRNGLSENKNFQTIVAPNHVANTISSHPTFAVYFPEAKGEFIVSLEEKGRKFNNKIWQQNLKVNKAGITTVTLPANIVGLQSGKDYRFSVKMVVNPKDRSQDIVAQVWLQKIELSPEIKAQIDLISNPEDRAIALAERGIWFDTIALLIENNDRSSRDLLINLLKQIGLEEVEQVATASY